MKFNIQKMRKQTKQIYMQWNVQYQKIIKSDINDVYSSQY